MRNVVLVSALMLLAGAAAASEFERVPPVRDAAMLKECGECHMAFQPALLPAASWSRIMSDLPNHFGEDASLPDRLAGEIRAYLTANAGPGDPGLTRITEQSWWQRKHRKRSIAWDRPEVSSKANCEACHPAAAKGLYDDD